MKWTFCIYTQQLKSKCTSRLNLQMSSSLILYKKFRPGCKIVFVIWEDSLVHFTTCKCGSLHHISVGNLCCMNLLLEVGAVFYNINTQNTICYFLEFLLNISLLPDKLFFFNSQTFVSKRLRKWNIIRFWNKKQNSHHWCLHGFYWSQHMYETNIQNNCF